MTDPAPTVRDQHEIDAVIARFFAAFDNREGRRPTLADITACFADKATVVRRSDAGTELMTVLEFATPRIELLGQGSLVDFHEWEVSATTQVHGGIATRTSRYRKAGRLDGGPYAGTGTKAFHLARVGSEWLITALAWVDDPP